MEEGGPRHGGMANDTGRQYHGRGGRPHREAFPAFDIKTLVRFGKTGHSAWEWVNENLKVIGKGFIRRVEINSFELCYDFDGSPNVECGKGVLTVKTEGRRINPNVLRKFFICSKCTKTLSTLFYFEMQWACAGCHNLVNLSQRLSPVNKAVYSRDTLALELAEVEPKRHTTRAYHNAVRRLARMNRELQEAGISKLPQELRFRTHLRWLEQGSRSTVSADPRQAAWTAGDPGGLAVFAPARLSASPLLPIAAPILRCKMIGGRLFYRPFASVLAEWHKQQFDERLRRSDVASLRGDALIEALADAIWLVPLALRPNWTEQGSGISDDGARELSATTIWTGEPLLWGISPRKSPLTDLPRAILSATAITLRARVPGKGDYDPAADIAYERSRLDAEITRLATLVSRLNTKRVEHAKRCVAEWT